MHEIAERYRLARRLRRAKKPSFRPLPAALLWPNPETVVMLVYCAGLVESAMAILGAATAGFIVPAWAMAVSLVQASRARRLRLFGQLRGQISRLTPRIMLWVLFSSV